MKKNEYREKLVVTAGLTTEVNPRATLKMEDKRPSLVGALHYADM